MNPMVGGPSGPMQNFDNFEQMPRQMQGQMQLPQMQDNMQQQMSSQQDFKMAMMQQQQQAAAQQQQQLRIPAGMNPGMNPQANQVCCLIFQTNLNDL